MEPIYLFIHLAKTGGTTFIGHLYKQLRTEKDFIDLGPHGEDYRREHHLPSLQERTQKEIDQIKVVAGHLLYWEHKDLFPNKEHRFVMFFREPISRVISHYTFDSSSENITFADWYKKWIKNQTYYFLLEHLRATNLSEILEKLTQFWHIGLKEQLDESLVTLFQELNISTNYINRRVAGELNNTTKELGYDGNRVIKHTYMPTQDEINQIIADHQLDIWLYNHIKSSLINFRYLPKTPVVIPSEFT